MTLDRRNFLQLAAGSALSLTLPTALAGPVGRPAFKAIAFDGFPLFDPRPIAALAESLFPGNGTALINAWRTRQFDYQWLRALSGRYVDFIETTRDSLRFAANQLQLGVSEEKEERLLGAWRDLKVWPDVPGAIKTFRDAGLRLAVVSNMTPGMLDGGLRRAGLDGMFEAIVSTDRIRTYKPDPKAYQLGVTELGLRKEDILFVAFAGWDVAGAKWFGHPTFWLNRTNGLREELGITPDGVGSDMAALTEFVLPAN